MAMAGVVSGPPVLKGECRCSLNLGLHPFPSSSSQKVDIINEKFPSLNDNLCKKADEFYLRAGNPTFHLFPPIVRPDTELGPFPPDNTDQQTKKNEEWNKRCEALSAEQKIAQLFLRSFYKSEETGFFVHPFHTDTYLGALKDKAKNERKVSAKELKCQIDAVPISQIEENLALCHGIQIYDKIAEKDKLNEKEAPNKKLKTEMIPHHCYQEMLRQTHCEIDNLLVVPNYIVNLEVKSVTDSSIKNVLTKAAKQLRNVNRTFVGSQKDILTEDWSFVRAIAMPNVDKTKIGVDICCPYCLSFIMGQEETKSYKEGVNNFMSLLPSKSSSLDSYKKLFSRLIGFYSSSEYHSVAVTMGAKDSRIESEKAITGLEDGISSEKGPLPPLDEGKNQNKKSKKRSGKPLHLYWNPNQLRILKNAKNLKRVIYGDDYGTGKTLLLKHFAVELSKQNAGVGKVYFISLAAAGDQNIGSISAVPAVMDVASEIDFEGTGVEVIGATYLLDNYNPDQDAKSVNDLLVRFMKDKEGSCFLIDEVPQMTVDDKFVGPDLSHLTGAGSSDSYVWLVLRPGMMGGNSNLIRFNADFAKFKEKLESEDFLFPSLGYNMRNTGSVVEAGNSNDKYYNSTVKPAVLPPNPVPGNTPIIVPYPRSDKRCDKHKPHNIVKAIVGKTFGQEPVVLITDDKDTRTDLIDSCKALTKVTAYFSDGTQIDKLRDFLTKPDGILVTDPTAFGGMQARNIICVSNNYDCNERNMLLRATTQLVRVMTDKYGSYDTDRFVVDRVAECCFDISDSGSDMDDDDGGDHDGDDVADHDNDDVADDNNDDVADMDE